MRTSSGGFIFRRRRKRRRAARLEPLDVDPGSTTSLFHDANGHDGHAASIGPRANGSHRPRATKPNGARLGTPFGEPNPLLRYEWRSPGGETVVVEAGWPTVNGRERTPPRIAEPTDEPTPVAERPAGASAVDLRVDP